METVKMTAKNEDGKLVEKNVDKRLVSIYKSMGWTLSSEKKVEKTLEKVFEK